MFVLRYLCILALVVWLGGMLVAGVVVAPSIFGVLQTWNDTQGRVLAGQVFGEVLQRIYWLGYAMGGVMFVTLTLHRLLGARPLRYGVRAAILAIMLGLTLAADYYVGPQVAAIQADVKGPVSSLAETDPRKIEFDRLHGLANILLSLTVLGGLVLLTWEARE